LSKRFGDVSVEKYREKGFTPEALLNGIALLGWNPPQIESEDTGSFKGSEVFSLDEMVEKFSMDKISKSGAKFSIEKLEYFNSHHITKSFSYSND
jgi:nondiscriminating glutamyl-tRNA synthetase